jgi:hypothetical protein
MLASSFCETSELEAVSSGAVADRDVVELLANRLIEVVRALEQQLWMVRAQRASRPIGRSGRRGRAEATLELRPFPRHATKERNGIMQSWSLRTSSGSRVDVGCSRHRRPLQR